IHAKLANTVLMITHDVDEAVLLSDRIVMMTNGPSAHIGEVLDVPLARPRKAGRGNKMTAAMARRRTATMRRQTKGPGSERTPCGDRQRHGGGAFRRRVVEPRSRPLRHRGDRRGTAPCLQSRAVVVGARRRSAVIRDRTEAVRLVA